MQKLCSKVMESPISTYTPPFIGRGLAGSQNNY